MAELYRENRLVAPATNLRRKRNADYLVRSRAGAVELFLNTLEQQLPADGNYSITLIGHSMGAIVANEILLRHPRKLPIDNIVYLAAACSVKECEDAVVPYLRQKEGRGGSAQFYSLSLHPIAEITETFMSPEKKHPSALDYSKASIGLFVPRGSLLHWLDAFFTTPLNLEDRRLGKWSTAISSAGIFPSDVSERIHLTMFPVGLSDLPQKHGQFDSVTFPTRFWQRKFWLPNEEPEVKALHEEPTSTGAPAMLPN
jgi:pimeloyl-ACP methyl ester carboxylesterase